MKLIACLFVLLIYNSAFTQSIDTGSSYVLVATNNASHNVYKQGARFFIRYSNGETGKKVRGVLTGFSDTEIVISTFSDLNNKTTIPIDSITKLRRINPRARLAFGIAGTALISVGAAVINNSSGSGFKDALIIPVIGAGSFLLYVVPISLLIEKLNEKTKTGGWTFSIEKR